MMTVLHLDKICFGGDCQFWYIWRYTYFDVGDIVNIEVYVEVWMYLAEALFMCLERAAVGEDGLLAAIVGITEEMAPISVITFPTASTASGLLQAAREEKQVGPKQN